MDNGLPTSIVIFGASGDLTKRKLVPALFHQYVKGQIPKAINIVGTSRSEFTHDEFRSASDDKAQKDKAHNPSVEAIGRVPVKHRVCLTRVYHEVHVRIGRA